MGDQGWAEMRGHERLTVKRRDAAREDCLHFEPVNIEKAELEAFAEAADGGSPYPVSWHDIVHATAVIEAVIRSGKTGETIAL